MALHLLPKELIEDIIAQIHKDKSKMSIEELCEGEEIGRGIGGDRKS